MTILSVVQNVCLAVGLQKPDAVMSSTDREMLELVRLAGDVAADIRDAEFDWQALQVIKDFNGDGVTAAFDLPDDYARMKTKATLWSSRWLWGMEHITDTDEWLELLTLPYVAVSGQWIIYGDQLHILPVLDAADTLKFVYISNLIVKPASGPNKVAFDADTDTFRLSERALELGMIYRYRDQKGVASDGDQAAYDHAVYTAMNNDKGSKPVVSGNPRRTFSNVQRAFPFKVTP
ncbi:phage adaptor protein [Rhizobium bangladeshense]|uniref:phage adaptor protein n=1 Tax=Rhizobium bangladeshense TaxID=1138189 RepID=UPI001C91393F|nr:hypothetical protein [Rhizobium bangladeshense]MBY3597568.1 hypothetical protein [Rhizobium bangladeshense]